MVSMEMEELITVAEAADECLVSEWTVRSWRHRGLIEPYGLEVRNGREVQVFKRGVVCLAAMQTNRRDLSRRNALAMRSA